MSRKLLLASYVTVSLLSGCGKTTSSSDKSLPANNATNKRGSKSVAEDESTVGNISEVVRLSLSPAEIEDGWINLFDGESLLGWTPISAANWRVEEGILVCDGDERGLLQSNFQFTDYEFRCDFKLEEGGNSGVFLRGEFQPSNPGRDCYELNMCDTHGSFPTGSLVGRHKAENVPATDGEWHSWHVICDGPGIIVRLDDQEVLNIEDSGEHARSVGYIGLQMNQGRIEFRNISLRPLAQSVLFDGSSMDGWREVPGGKSDFKVVDNELSITNGAGFLETEEQFGNFILQAAVKPNDIALNSGIFFRAMRGTADAPSHGYEMQIQNGVKNGDPTKPADAGTGAIFRRQAARRVNARDREWSTVTLIAQGNHIGSWVNGYQVVDWKDDREPNDNPRKGRRVTAGHISLQGHDPTTDLRFRNIRISDAPFE